MEEEKECRQIDRQKSESAYGATQKGATKNELLHRNAARTKMRKNLPKNCSNFNFAEREQITNNNCDNCRRSCNTEELLLCLCNCC